MTSSILAACERRGDAEEFEHASSVADSLAPSNGQLESSRDLFGEDGAARRTYIGPTCVTSLAAAAACPSWHGKLGSD